MPDCIKLNKGNIDVCEREVIALREIIAAAMGRLHQIRKQCEHGYASSEDFENALDAYGVIHERVDELDQLGFEFRWSSIPDVGIDEYDGLEWIDGDNPPRERGFILLVNVSEWLIGDKMYPYYECDNYPMSITDDDGPFLIMEARLSGDDELNDDFRKDASYRYSCATVSAAIDLCRSLTDSDVDYWYESWEKAVERLPLEECESATMLYWIEPTDPYKALCACHPHPDLEKYVVEAIGAVDTYLLERDDCPFSVDHLDLKDVGVLLSAAWGLARVLEEAWGTCDPDVLEKIEDATFNAYTTVEDLIAGEEAAKASAKSDDTL